MQTGKIGGQFRTEPQDLTGRWVRNGQYMGMESLSAKGRKCALGCLRQQRRLGAKPCPIGLIAEEGMADRGQMHPNLVGSSGFEAAQRAD